MSENSKGNCGTKTCSHCNQIKPETEFYMQNGRRQSHCRSCFLKKKKKDYKFKKQMNKRRKPIQEISIENITYIPISADKQQLLDIHDIFKEFILNKLIAT